MWELIAQPWPWWVAGPLIGVVVALLLLVDGRAFGVSSTLRHVCAATLPGRSRFLDYDWRRQGTWNLVFALGIVLGGFLAAHLAPGRVADRLTDGMIQRTPDISDATQADLVALGVSVEGLVPAELYSLAALRSPVGWWVLGLGGFLVGFGARWAGGCTSGHAISGLANLQLPSLVAVLGFFAGGLVATHLFLPWILGGGG